MEHAKLPYWHLVLQAGIPNTTKEHYMQVTAPLRRLQPVIAVRIMTQILHRAHDLRPVTSSDGAVLSDRLQDTLGQLDYYQFEDVVTAMVAPQLAVPRLNWATSALLTFKQARLQTPARSRHLASEQTLLSVMHGCEALLL